MKVTVEVPEGQLVVVLDGEPPDDAQEVSKSRQEVCHSHIHQQGEGRPARRFLSTNVKQLHTHYTMYRIQYIFI